MSGSDSDNHHTISTDLTVSQSTSVNHGLAVLASAADRIIDDECSCWRSGTGVQSEEKQRSDKKHQCPSHQLQQPDQPHQESGTCYKDSDGSQFNEEDESDESDTDATTVAVDDEDEWTKVPKKRSAYEARKWRQLELYRVRRMEEEELCCKSCVDNFRQNVDRLISQPRVKRVKITKLVKLKPATNPVAVNKKDETYINSNWSSPSSNGSSARTFFADGLRLIFQFLSTNDFKVTKVFRLSRHFWRSSISMLSIGFTDPIFKSPDTITHTYSPTMLDSPLGYHCKNLALTLSHASSAPSMINLVSARWTHIEHLKLIYSCAGYWDHYRSIRPFLKLRRLISLTIIGFPIDPLFTANLRLPETLRKITWEPYGWSSMIGTPAYLPPNKPKLIASPLPHLREFEFRSNIVEPEELLQAIHLLPNLTHFSAKLTHDCFNLLADFKHLRSLRLGLFDGRVAWDHPTSLGLLTPTLLKSGLPFLSQLTTLEIDMVDHDFNLERDEQDWKTFLSGMTELTSLTLSHLSSFTPSLSYLHLLPKLTALKLNQFPAPTESILAQLRDCALLKQLFISSDDDATTFIYTYSEHYRPALIGDLFPNLELVEWNYTRFQFISLAQIQADKLRAETEAASCTRPSTPTITAPPSQPTIDVWQAHSKKMKKRRNPPNTKGK